LGTRALRGREAPPPRVVPRPRADRAHALRRVPRARRRRGASRQVAAGTRTRVQARRRGALRGFVKVAAKPDTRFRTPPAAVENVDARALAADLHRALEGEVRFGAGTRALYTTGGSNYRQVPIGVVIPKTIDDVVAAV